MTFEELLAELQGLINPARTMPPPQPVTSAEELRTPVNALLAAAPAGPPVQPTGELRAYEPTAGERARAAVNRMLTPVMGAGTAERVGGAVNRMIEYGPVPAQVATDVAMQPVRAGEALGEALHDPTLANVTNAGVQTGMAVMRPMAALGALGAGYGEALRRDLGIGIGGAAAEEGQPQTNPLQALFTQMAGLEQRRADAEARVKAESRTGQGPRWQAAMSELQQIEGQIQGLQRLIEEEQKRSSPEQAEYNRAVERAEAARDAERARATRFQDTEVGQVFQQTGGLMAPAAAVGAGAIARAAHGGRGAMGNYVAPYLEGTFAAGAANNAPLIYDAFLTPTANPERLAQEAYARELPPGHPRREEARALAQSLPEANPVREQAQREFIEGFFPRLGASAVEGIGGLLGANMVSAAGRPVNAMLGAVRGRGAPPQRAERIIERRVDKAGRTYYYDPEKRQRVSAPQRGGE